MIYNGSRPYELTLHLKDKQGPYTYQDQPQVVPVPEECYGGDAKAPRNKAGLPINFYYEIRQFLDAIQYGKETLLTLERGKYVQELIRAAQDSADLGEIVCLDNND